MIEVYTDGSGLATGGPGGIAYVYEVDGRRVENSLSLSRATNQQAEILAAALALHELEPADHVRVWSDSEYLVRGMTEWLPGWVEKGWRTASGKPVANQPHWRRLLAARDSHGTVEFRWVRGHNGTRLNERADELAGQARQRQIAAERLALESG